MTAVSILPLHERSQHDEPEQFAVNIQHEPGRRLLDYMAVLRDVFHYAEPLAWRLSRQIARTTQADVWVGSREVAEFKRDQIREYALRTESMWPPLRVTIERLARGETVCCRTRTTGRRSGR